MHLTVSAPSADLVSANAGKKATPACLLSLMVLEDRLLQACAKRLASARHGNCCRAYAGRGSARMGNGNRGLVTVRIPVRLDFAGGWSDVHYFSAREGGAVLNAAISPYVEGSARWEGWQLHLEFSLSLPPGSHLGTSASVDVAWLVLTNGLTGRKQSPVELAEAAYHLEKML